MYIYFAELQFLMHADGFYTENINSNRVSGYEVWFDWTGEWMNGFQDGWLNR